MKYEEMNSATMASMMEKIFSINEWQEEARSAVSKLGEYASSLEVEIKEIKRIEALKTLEKLEANKVRKCCETCEFVDNITSWRCLQPLGFAKECHANDRIHWAVGFKQCHNCEHVRCLNASNIACKYRIITNDRRNNQDCCERWEILYLYEPFEGDPLAPAPSL